MLLLQIGDAVAISISTLNWSVNFSFDDTEGLQYCSHQKKKKRKKKPARVNGKRNTGRIFKSAIQMNNKYLYQQSCLRQHLGSTHAEKVFIFKSKMQLPRRSVFLSVNAMAFLPIRVLEVFLKVFDLVKILFVSSSGTHYLWGPQQSRIAFEYSFQDCTLPSVKTPRGLG